MTARRIRTNSTRRAEHGEILFNPTVTTHEHLANGFRVFTEQARLFPQPAHRLIHRFEVPAEAITVYTDGSCILAGFADAVAGSGVWYGPEDPRNVSLRLPAALRQTSQAAEICAVLIAVITTPPFAPLHIISDSLYVVDGLTLFLPDWEATGWIDIPNASLLQTVTSRLRKRTAPTTFRWVKGHSVVGNEGADRLANLATAKPAPGLLDTSTDHHFLFSSAALQSLTQSLAYRAICQSRPVEPRRATARHIPLVQNALRDLEVAVPSVSAIWSALRVPDVRRPLWDFFWKALHGVHKCGPYWAHIPGYESRADCPLCPGQSESLEHILLQCSAPERSLSWALARTAWVSRGREWPAMSFGLILGALSASFAKANGRPDGAISRLFRFLISETAYLIWRLRCERRIGRLDDPTRFFSTVEIIARWNDCMTRLTVDRAAARLEVFGGRSLPPQLVLDT
ncbi:hypothetical protein EIP86_001884 [Pleurotus ostreatoroseus]|nr:hypothetical protein EIP86_001884 [Pleurotus ostreatoroseus]